MKIIDIKKTDKTPEVILDTDKQLFQIKGRCLPENIRDFGKQVLASLDEYLAQQPVSDSERHAPGAFRVHFKLGYFNSASAKFIADVLSLAGSYTQKGYNIKSYWYFDEDDHDMLEAGEEISQMVNVPMEFITIARE